MQTLALGNSLALLGDYAFYNCQGLEAVKLPATLTSIGQYVFQNCTGLTDVKFENSIIGNYMFAGCTSLTGVVLSETLTRVGNYAFNGCTGIKHLTLGVGITTLGQNAFAGCNAIETVTSKSDIAPSMGNSACFNTNVYNDATLYIPIGAIEDYLLTNYWNKFAHIVEKNLDVVVGDVDGDGRISISDVTSLIGLLLAGGGDGNAAADVDGDGLVSISDVTTLIDQLLNAN